MAARLEAWRTHDGAARASLALAAGLGLPVLVVWCSPSLPLLPVWPGFSRRPRPVPGARAFRLVPVAPAPLPLFAAGVERS